MKNSVWMLGAFVALLAVGCSKETPMPDATAQALTLRGEILPVQTRTSLDDDGLQVLWTAGDRIGVYGDAHNTPFKLATGAGQETGTFTGTNANPLYAYYPYASDAGDDPTAVNLVVLPEQTQVKTGVANISSRDLKVATSISEEGGVLTLHFRQALAMLRVQLDVSGTDLVGENLNAVTFSDQLSGEMMTGVFTLDVTQSASALKPLRDTTTSVRLLFEDKPVLADQTTIEGWAFVNPTVKRGDDLQIVIVTSGHKATVRVKAAQDFLPGYRYNLPLKLSRLTQSLTVERNQWNGVDVAKPQLKEGVYQISNEAEMAYFQFNVLEHPAVLTADIDLQHADWTPVQVAGVSFDGGNHTISNLKVTKAATLVTTSYEGVIGLMPGGSGFFGMVAKAADGTLPTISNVKIVGADVTGTSKWSGSLAGVAAANFQNCSAENVSVKVRDYRVGGLVGFIQSGNAAKVTGCSAKNVDLSGSMALGGLIGSMQSGNKTVSGCTVSGLTITVTGLDMYAGGPDDMVGYVGTLVGDLMPGTTTTFTFSDNTVPETKAEWFSVQCTERLVTYDIASQNKLDGQDVNSDGLPDLFGRVDDNDEQRILVTGTTIVPE